jgi:hypothetical protein
MVDHVRQAVRSWYGIPRIRPTVGTHHCRHFYFESLEDRRLLSATPELLKDIDLPT